jgi:hypothetical protein
MTAAELDSIIPASPEPASLVLRGVNRGKIELLGTAVSDHDRQRIVAGFRDSWPTRSTRLLVMVITATYLTTLPQPVFP